MLLKSETFSTVEDCEQDKAAKNPSVCAEVTAINPAVISAHVVQTQLHLHLLAAVDVISAQMLDELHATSILLTHC